MVDVGGNYHEILDRIAAAAAKARRDPGEIKLLAAAKSQSVEAVSMALAAGVTLIGENYVQEAAEKKKKISQSAEWHMIGHLQRNKVKAVAELFDVIESLDSFALARELDKEGAKRGTAIRALVEVNLGGEPSKSGIAPEQAPALFETVSKFAHLRIEGLMTVAPFRENPEDVRPFFRELRALRDRLKQLNLAGTELLELSMGMTHDYIIAIEEGATIVRVGTALFGPRRS